MPAWLIASAIALAGCAGKAPPPGEGSTPVAEPAPAPTDAPAPAIPPSPEPTPTPTPSPEPAPTPTCVGLTATGKWIGRKSGDTWIDGIYPTDDLPAGTVVLTFDDGPHARTGHLLDQLAAHRMKATFFVVARAIRGSNYQLIRRMVDEGHTLGNHTYSHPTRVASDGGKRGVELIRIQFELAQAMVDLALIATSKQDFDALAKRMRGGLSFAAHADELLDRWPRISERHQAILQERGFAPGQHPYPLLYSRPPGGNPFLGTWEVRGREHYSRAVRELGMLNIMWHHNSEDSDPALPPKVRYDPQRIAATLTKTADKGGVWVAHDRSPSEAIELGLDKLANDPKYKVISLQELLEAKYGCELSSVAALLAPETDPSPPTDLTKSGTTTAAPSLAPAVEHDGG